MCAVAEVSKIAATTSPFRTMSSTDVASHPDTGEPHLVFRTLADQPMVSIAKYAGQWHVWATTVVGVTVDLKANWVGCGRPAAEILTYARVGPPEWKAGWYLLEAR